MLWLPVSSKGELMVFFNCRTCGKENADHRTASSFVLLCLHFIYLMMLAILRRNPNATASIYASLLASS
jgi:hypothetical protein